jgi:hypothetical protein
MLLLVLLLHLSNTFNCFYLFQDLPPLDIADMEEIIQLSDDASEMLAYEAVLELDRILEEM